MESRFGYDFNQVRVHVDSQAADSARAVNALAYTVGHDIVFDAGQYAPHSRAGQRLLVHELAHIVQNNAPAGSLQKIEISDPDAPAEREAEIASERFARHQQIQLVHRGTARLARQQNKEQTENPSGKPKAATDVTTSQTGPSAAAQTASGSASYTLPSCNRIPVKSWIPDPTAQRGGKLFGLTTIAATASGVVGTVPEFRVEPAPGGKGVKVKPTSTAMQPIEMRFLAPGQYPDTASHQWQCDADVDQGCMPGEFVKPQIVWDVTQDGSNRLAEGEEEHCMDWQAAFYLTFGRIAELINVLANSGRAFPNEAAARAELQKTVKLQESDWKKYFACLGEGMQSARDRQKWHTPLEPINKTVRKRMKLEFGSGRQTVAKVPVILPQVKTGTKWVHSVWDVLQNAAAGCNAKIPWKP
jgi:hypothetical protein